MADETVVANTAASLEGQTLLINGGQLGTPSSGDLQNCDGLPAATGLTGVVPAAQGGAGTVSGLLKADGLGTVSAAAAGTDYANLTFKTIAVSGQSDVVADSAADTLTLAAGTGVTLATTPGSDTVTISATGTGGTVTANGTLTSGKTIVGDGTTVITASALTATVVKSASGTLSAASAGTDYTDAAFKTIAVSGQSDVIADTPADTLTLAAGSGVTITTNAGTDTVTIAATGTGGTVTATGTLTSGKLIQGNGTTDVTANATTATVVKLTAGTPSAATAGTDYTDNAFKTIAVSGQSDVVADSAADTLTLAAGTGVTITTNASTDTITITAAGTGGTVTTTGSPASGNLTKFSGSSSVTNADLTGDVTTSGTVATTLKTAAKTRAITFAIDGGGSAITTGVKADVYVPYACTITAVTILADLSGSVVVDIWKDTYANYPPVVGDSITASAKPTVTTGKSQDTTLTGWTTSISAGDSLRFNIDSAATVTRLAMTLTVTV